MYGVREGKTGPSKIGGTGKARGEKNPLTSESKKESRHTLGK